eukprot:124581_1
MCDESDHTIDNVTNEKQTVDNKTTIDIPSLKLKLKDESHDDPTPLRYKNIPLSAPTKITHKKRTKLKRIRNPPNTAMNRHQITEKHISNKIHIPYTPRLDELPLSLRLHSNPMILLQSIRRQKISNYNMHITEPAIDNKPNKYLLKYSNRRKKLRECNNPFPKINKLPNYKDKKRITLTSIDNQLPKNIISFRKMRKNRLRNAEKRARKLYEQRLQSPTSRAKPKPPTRTVPPNTNKRMSQIQRQKRQRKYKKNAIKSKSKKFRYNNILYVSPKISKKHTFLPSPKRMKASKLPTIKKKKH